MFVRDESDDHLAAAFTERFGRRPEFIARAPGRVNLIGEHTDYNGGLVLPIAIDRQIRICFAPRDDQTINLLSSNFNQNASFSLELPLSKQNKYFWVNYVKGIADVLQRSRYQTRGFDGLVYGNIPIASGLSSSAALEVATVLAFIRLSGQSPLKPLEVAKLAQQAENEFVGVNCGLMDQFISASAIKGCALKISCDTMVFTPIEIPADLAIVVANTKLNRSLAGSAYNHRRAECEQALASIKSRLSNRFEIETMNDVSIEAVAAAQDFLPPSLFRRIKHVATENQRVAAAVEALADGDLSSLGQLFNASHNSLRDDYEVSSKGLDQVTSLMRATAGCYGARLTGAGFGGCAIAAVEASKVDRFISQLTQVSTALEPTPEVFLTRPVAGASVSEVR